MCCCPWGGSPEAPLIHGHAGVAGLTWRGEPVGTVTGRWDHVDEVSSVTARWGHAEGPGVDLRLEAPMLIHLRGGVIQARPEAPHSLQVTAKDLTERHLRPFWVAPPSMRLTLGGTLSASGDLDDHTARVDLKGGLTGKDGRTLPWTLRGDGDPRRQQAQFDLGPGVLVVAVGTGVDTTGVIKGEAWLQDAPAEGRLALDLPVQTLAPFVPAGIYDPTGRVVGEIKGGGTLGRPSFSGAFRAEDAALTLLGANQRLRSLQLSARVDGTTLQVERLSAQAGLGSVEAELRSTWTPTPKGAPHEAGLWEHAITETEATARLKRFPLVQDGLDIGAAAGVVTVRSTSTPHDARVQVDIAEAAIDLTAGRLPDVQAVPVNDTVQVLDWAGAVVSGGGREDPRDRVILDLTVKERIEVTGPEARLSVGGRMRLLKSEGEAVVSGGLRLIPGGSITLLDTPFEVHGGVLTLEPGPLPTRPVVDLDARARVVDTHVVVKLKGPTLRPELILGASPALPEYQIITLLLTGRVDAVDDKNGNVRRKVAQLVSRFHSPSLKQQLFDRLGIDKLKVKFKSLAQPMLTVGKQLDRQWYVESVYRHNSEPDENEKEGRVQYQLDRLWTLDTTYGDAGEGTVGAFWRHRFGAPPPAPPPKGWAKDL